MFAPSLRFAGFNEPWSETSLGKISSFITSGSRDWAQYYADGGDKFIRMTNLVRDGITLNLSDLKFVRLPENSNEGKRTALQHHDILISITAELGKLGWVPDDLGTAYINQHTALVRPNLSIVSSKFIANLLSTKKYNNILNQQNDSGAKSGLNLSTIKNFGFYATNKIEQTKIADFLSSVDEKIVLLSKQHDLLCRYKKGMMQKIFSQELRFKDECGEDFPVWHHKNLGDICRIRTGKLDANAMVVGGKYRFYTCAREFYQIDEYAFDTEALLISGNGANVGYIHYYSGKFNAYQRTYVLDGFIHNIEYVKYFLDMYLNERIYGEKKEGNTPYIVMGTLADMQIKLPIIKEQTKIANFLSSLDDKITVKKAELDKLITWKHGLLQQMFV
ncbi:restriction endonuclease subunit S [Klebsiella sp. WP8-S18-ESBL-06]|uniref:restriction endonuclease subunit S n=1 Tax=Klebsiella sp. WP8-S18-ESBL-06 TaxID=2675726 RepID=UPI0018D6AF56|nr:restriction endonuclease subunit S [Klebsiella sp. WP8-S18-ESBL-06]